MLGRLLQHGLPAIADTARAIRHRQPRLLLFAGRGSSHHAGVYARYLFERRNRVPTSQVAPSIYTRSHQVPTLHRAVVIGVSQSGRSADIAEVLAYTQRHGAMTVAITNDVESEMARVADHTLALCAGIELSIPASKTYTASLVTLALLSSELDPEPGLIRGLHELPNLVAKVLQDEDLLVELGQGLATERAVVISRGYQLATALEIALKLSEVAGIGAVGMSAAELVHGWIAAISAEVPALILEGGEVMDEDLHELSSRLRTLGSPVAVLTSDPAAYGPTSLVLPRIADPALAPVLTAVAGQLIALGASRARGTDPDHPRGLSKVTVTN